MVMILFFFVIILNTTIYTESTQGVVNSRVIISACDLQTSAKTKYIWSVKEQNSVESDELYSIESLEYSCLASFKTAVVGEYTIKVLAIDLIANETKQKEITVSIFTHLNRDKYRFTKLIRDLKESHQIEYFSDAGYELLVTEKKDESIYFSFSDFDIFKDKFGESTVKIYDLSNRKEVVISSNTPIHLYKNSLYSFYIYYFEQFELKIENFENYYPEDFLSIYSEEKNRVNSNKKRKNIIENKSQFDYDNNTTKKDDFYYEKHTDINEKYKTDSSDISIYSNNIRVRGIFTYFFENFTHSTINPTILKDNQEYTILFTPYKEIYNLPNIKITKEELLESNQFYYKDIEYFNINFITDRSSFVTIKSKESFNCLSSPHLAECEFGLSFFFDGGYSIDIPEGEYIVSFGEAKTIDRSFELSLRESQTVELNFSPKTDKIPVIMPENGKMITFDDGKSIYSFKVGDTIKVYPNQYDVKVYYDNGVILVKDVEISPNNQTVKVNKNEKQIISIDESGYIFLNFNFYLKAKKILTIIF